MYDSGVVAGQNGEIWSRGLPASWVMVVLRDVDGRGEVAHDPVGRHRDRVGAAAYVPVGQPLGADARDPGGDGRGALRARLADAVADRLEEALQDELRVADQPDLHRHDLVEIGRVERRVDVAPRLPATGGRNPSS